MLSMLVCYYLGQGTGLDVLRKTGFCVLLLHLFTLKVLIWHLWIANLSGVYRGGKAG